MKKLVLMSVVGLALLFSTSAQAAFIVDTGSGDTQFGVSVYNRTNGDIQFNAGQFTTTQAYTIASLETWMYSTDAGTVEMVLYGDDNNLPDPAQEIFRQSFAVAAPGPITSWQGVSGLNLFLNPGQYWLSVEKSVPTDGFQVNLPTGAPNPLDQYAFFAEEEGSVWTNYNGHQGFRVGVVPEPSTAILFSLGTGLFGMLKKKQIL